MQINNSMNFANKEKNSPTLNIQIFCLEMNAHCKCSDVQNILFFLTLPLVSVSLFHPICINTSTFRCKSVTLKWAKNDFSIPVWSHLMAAAAAALDFDWIHHAHLRYKLLKLDFTLKRSVSWGFMLGGGDMFLFSAAIMCLSAAFLLDAQRW